MLLILVTDTCCLFTRFGCTVKSVLGPVEILVLSGFCAELCQYNCVPLTKQCLGLLTVDLYQFHLKKKKKKSLAKVRMQTWALKNRKQKD